MYKITVRLTAAAFAACMSAQLPTSSALAKAAENELVIAQTADIRSLNGTGRDAATDTVLHHIYETLVGFRADLTVGPALAESWEVSPDKTTYTFHLREGAKFHNGDPVTAQDVKWSWDFHMNPGRKVSCRANFDGSRQIKLLSLETPNERTVVFKIEKPSPLFLTRLAEVQCNLWVASPKNTNADGEWKADSAIGSGPFKLDERVAGDHTTLMKFDGYVASKQPKSGYSGDRTPAIEKVTFRVIPDYTVQEVALKAGDVDIVNSVNPKRAQELEAEGFKRETSAGLGWTTFLVQTNDPLLSDPKMRAAIAHAINAKEIAEVRTTGTAEPNPSAIARTSPYFEDSMREWPDYDLAKAKALLAEAGYKSQPLMIQTNTRYQAMYDNAIMLQAMLMQAGINAQLETLEWGTQLDRFNSGKFQLQSFIWSPRLDPSLNFGSFIGAKATDPSSQWDNQEADALYRESLSEVDPVKRGKIFATLHQMMAKDLPIFSLYYNSVNAVIGANIAGYTSWPVENPIAWGVSKK